MKTRPETTACLKLFVLDGDRDTVMVARATTGRNSAASVSSSSPASSVTAGPVLATSPTSSGGRRLLSGGRHERSKREECRLVVQRSADRGGIRRPPRRG
jgi:hypothetical protein